MDLSEEIIRDRMLGCLYGQAIGDALGLGTEFMRKSEVSKYYPQGLSAYSQIVGNDNSNLWKSGSWTDDTDMMLCILDGFENGHFDINKIALNFKEWFNGDLKGIGRHTYNLLYIGDYVKDPIYASKVVWESSRCQSAANGGLMRTFVVGLPRNISNKDIEDICRLTHYDPRCVGSCVVVSRLINNLIWKQREMTLDELKDLGRMYDPMVEEWIELAYYGQLSDLRLDDRQTMGYTLRTLAAGLWTYFHAVDFKNGLLSIVNEGGDADTNAAVACSVLGAKFGFSTIPKFYVSGLYKVDVYDCKIRQFIDGLLRMKDDAGMA